MLARIKFRRDTAANWTTNNPILAAGEPGFETDTGKIKIGDGSTAWTSLSYVTDLSIKDLTDVDASMSPTNGQVLQWDGSQWTSATIAVNDEMVKSDSGDSSAGYLDAKVDGESISVDTTNHVLQVNVDNNSIVIDTTNHYIKVDDSKYVHTTGDETIGGNKTFSNNVTVQGDLTVNGTTTTVNSTNLEIQDNEILLNKGESGAGVTAGRAGIRIDRGTSNDELFYFDENDDTWKIGQWDDTNSQIISIETLITDADSIKLLADVDDSMSPTSDQVLSWDGTKWTSKTISTLSDSNKVLADDTDTTPGYLSDKIDTNSLDIDTTNHVIKVKDGVYALSSHTHAWADVSKSGSSVKDLDDINSSMTPSDGQVLAWDNTNNYWTAQTLDVDGGNSASW